jgi:hypothetical protein
MAGAETWHRILNAIERLQVRTPAEGEKVHCRRPLPGNSVGQRAGDPGRRAGGLMRWRRRRVHDSDGRYSARSG